ncbi:MAG: PPOX class F420-dependent oxidoreductase [Thermomicrobiales bacterium]
MFVLPDSARELLLGPASAHLITINPDGSPQASLTWETLEGDEIVIASMTVYAKIRNVQRDPRVVITFESPEKNEMGLVQYLTVHGTATVVPGGAVSVLRAQAKRYLGPDAMYPPGEFDGSEGYLMRIRIDRIGGTGPWSSTS